MARPSSWQRPEATGAVDTFLASLEHPHKEGIQLLREAILGLDGRIREEVKWNAPSFLLEDHFATFRLHPPRSIQLVLHTGAKPKSPPRQFVLQGAETFAKWAAPDRCVLNIGDSPAARRHCQVIVGLVRQWMQQL